MTLFENIVGLGFMFLGASILRDAWKIRNKDLSLLGFGTVIFGIIIYNL